MAMVLLAVTNDSRRLSTTMRSRSETSFRSALLMGKTPTTSSSYSWRLAGVSGMTVIVRGAVTW
ncbi:hypothetical protein D3C83_275680 [compost metagenome]